MLTRARNHVTYLLERLIMRGPIYRLLIVAAALGLISLVTGRWRSGARSLSPTEALPSGGRSCGSPIRATSATTRGPFCASSPRWSPSDLARIEPSGYDNIVLVASDRFETEEASDARTILAYRVLRELLRDVEARPSVLIELLVSPMVLSHVLTQVALRRELGAVFDELFSSEGTEILFRSIGDVGWTGEEMSFEQVQAELWSRGEIALGLRAGGELTLNPRKSRIFRLSGDDAIVSLWHDEHKVESAHVVIR